MAGWTGFVDPRRGVIAMVGADTRAVLQGVVTNDVDRLAPGAPLYAALLTPQGKYLFDFFLVDPGDGRVLIDVARDQGQPLAQKLMMYSLRRDAHVQGTGNLQVALAWGEQGTPPLPEGTLVVPDPRAKVLGVRLYGEGLDLAQQGISPATTAEHDALRVAHHVPETGVELQPNDTFILEAGFERLNGVDFRKGCYVGQEVTARMKHKTELRKGLVTVTIEGEASPGTPITAAGKPVGTLFTTAGGQGLANLRFDRAGPDMAAGAARVDYTP